MKQIFKEHKKIKEQKIDVTKFSDKDSVMTLCKCDCVWFVIKIVFRLYVFPRLRFMITLHCRAFTVVSSLRDTDFERLW